MRLACAWVVLVGVAACGADGEPVTPTRDATITISNHGVSAHTSVGVRQGPLSLRLGLGL